ARRHPRGVRLPADPGLGTGGVAVMNTGCQRPGCTGTYAGDGYCDECGHKAPASVTAGASAAGAAAGASGPAAGTPVAAGASATAAGSSGPAAARSVGSSLSAP